ncbi:MAG: peptidoglycan-binding protein [Clostridiales bacterium]|nr:peptidoglycan-binding protein [Clostridiales bacterium]
MKQRRLLLALIAMLALFALVLSGCYVAPDDVSTSQQSGDNLDFPTINPATAAPTSAPAPTATPAAQQFPTNPPSTPDNGTINLPTGAINNWTTIAPISTQAGSTAGPVTPPPSRSPSPTPQGSLKLGSTGQEVRQIQQKLKDLGFLKGSVDGDFGEATEKAVKAFQKQYGLTVDGKVGQETMAKLASARATAKPAITPTPKPSPTPSYANVYLRRGNSGAQVKQLQNRLITLGYLKGKATGEFDLATEAAVIAFQNRNTSYADGVAGPETLRALYSSNARKAFSPAGIIGSSLREGDGGEEVRLLQERLKRLGYYSGNVDGDFGAGTVNAVKAFQRQNGLTADGVAGSGTLSRLFSSSAKSYTAPTATPRPTPTRKPTATPRATSTPLPPNIYVLVTAAPGNDYATLRRGMYGTPVQQMQEELKKQGFYTGVTDGYFGEGTENAVKAFQRTNGLYVDGAAGPATLRVLFEGDFPFGS